MTPGYRAALLAALPTGALVLLAFFVWHWFTIAPVWNVLVEGAVGVVIASSLLALSWEQARKAGRFHTPWGGLAFGAVFAGGLLVGEVVGLARGPRPDPQTFGEIMAALPFALLAAAAVAGAGAWIVRAPRGAVSFGGAALVLIVYLGGVAVQRGGVGLGLSLLLLLVPTYLAAGVIFGAIYRRLRPDVAASYATS